LITGIKRHIGVDTNGLPHATTANVSPTVPELWRYFRACKTNLTRVIKVFADGGYTGEAFSSGTLSTIGVSVEIAKRSELHKFAVIPKRWVVERSFAWLEKCRRL
jgi:transposase